MVKELRAGQDASPTVSVTRFLNMSEMSLYRKTVQF